MLSDNKLQLATNPSIENLQIVSDIKTQQLHLEFQTDEPTTSTLFYGEDSSYGEQKIISSELSIIHTIALNNIISNQVIYFKLEVKDSGFNTTVLSSQTKQLPLSPSGFTIESGESEIGLVWDKLLEEEISGYNLYRSSDGKSYLKLNDEPITNLYFIDKM